MHIAPDVTSWCTNVKEQSSKSLAAPQGDGSLEHERLSNTKMAIALRIVILCVSHGVFYALEHPRHSRMWRLPLIIFVLG